MGAAAAGAGPVLDPVGGPTDGGGPTEGDGPTDGDGSSLRAGETDAAASGRLGVGSGTAVPRSRELVRTARTSSTTKLTSTAKPSRERTTRESEPKPATSAVPSVRAENSAPEPAVPRSASTNRATTRLYATTRSTAPRLITASAAVVARGPPPRVTGSRWLIAPSSTCSRKPATKGTVSCCTSAATREVAICASAERHHVTSSPAVVSANQPVPAVIDRIGNGASGTRRSWRTPRTPARTSVAATQAKEPR